MLDHNLTTNWLQGYISQTPYHLSFSWRFKKCSPSPTSPSSALTKSGEWRTRCLPLSNYGGTAFCLWCLVCLWPVSGEWSSPASPFSRYGSACPTSKATSSRCTASSKSSSSLWKRSLSPCTRRRGESSVSSGSQSYKDESQRISTGYPDVYSMFGVFIITSELGTYDIIWRHLTYSAVRIYIA